MRIRSIVREVYQPHQLALLFLLVLGASPGLGAQMAASGGYARQHLDAGIHSGGIAGYSMDLAVRVGRRVDLLFGYEQLDHEPDAVSGERHLWSFRTGIHVLAARSRVVELGLATGIGLFELDVDSEDNNGGGLTGFVQARLTIHPVPVVGVYLGGMAQALSALGVGGGGTSYGLALGVQLRSDGW